MDSNKKERESLQKEIYSLRKGAGLATWKLDHLIYLPALIAKRLNILPEQLSTEQLKAYVAHEIDALGESPQAAALKNALALNLQYPKTLTIRRNDLAKQTGKHPDTIEAYENRAIATLVRRLLSSSSPSIPQDIISPAPSPSSSDRIENAMRSLISQGLGDLLGVDSRAPELLRCFNPNTPPYQNTSIEWQLLPSHRGKEWYSNRLRYTFQRNKNYFRVAITNSALDSEALMISGVVDDVIKLDRAPATHELLDLQQSMRFIVKEESGRQHIYLFTELDKTSTQQILNQFWQVESGNCRILEVQIPDVKNAAHTIYEYWLTYHIRIHEQHAFWYSPGLMFLNNIVVDVSRFPERKKWDIHILPFFGHVFPGTVESTGDRFTMPANSWIMQGHGIALTWHKK